MEQYLSFKEFEGSSSIKNAVESDQDYIWFRKRSGESTDAQEWGTAMHMAILEPELFDATYYVFDDSQKVKELIDNGAKTARATKEYKEWYAEQVALNGDRIILEKDTFDACQIVRERLQRDSRYHEWVAPAQKEMSVYVEDFYNGMNVKIRLDSFIAPKETDIKSTKGISPKNFFYECLKYKYHLQRALYRDVANAAGIELTESAILAISNKPPFQHEFYTIPEELIEEGRGLYRLGLDNIARMRNGNVHDGFAQNYITDKDGFILLGDK